MPPRRGRGRGSGRARPPQAIPDSMTDIGLGSIANFDLIIQATANANADAARAYFPILEQARKASPAQLQQSEHKLVTLERDVQSSIRASPHAVNISRARSSMGGASGSGRGGGRAGGRGRGASAWKSQLDEFAKSFGVAADTEQNNKDSTSIWKPGTHWIVPELLPRELLPKEMRQGSSKRPAKRARTSKDAGTTSALLSEADVKEGVSREANADDDDQEIEKDKEDADNPEGEPAPANEDSDLELDADYQTGQHFDDDDGYEEKQSGDENEATF